MVTWPHMKKQAKQRQKHLKNEGPSFSKQVNSCHAGTQLHLLKAPESFLCYYFLPNEVGHF